MRWLAVFLASLALTMRPFTLWATTIHGPADRPTIQDGIDAAVDGDSLVAAPGTLHEWGIDSMGKAIVVASADPSDPSVVASTIVDADFSGSVFRFQSAEGPASRLSGLTITGGSSDNGGGICCDGASPTISRNVITGNVVVGSWPDCGLARGVSFLYSDAILEDNVI